MEIVQKTEVGAWRWIKIVLLQESICICNKAGVYISHTDLTDLTDFFDKYIKDTFASFMCVAHLLYVLSSLLVNKLTDSSDKSSNQPMAYERCKSKDIEN